MSFFFSLVPWKAIGLATLLFAIGSILIVVGVLIYLGFITTEDSLGRSIPLLVLGSIMFIPGKSSMVILPRSHSRCTFILGAYHLYIAYYAYYKYPGYEFSMIPDWED